MGTEAEMFGLLRDQAWEVVRRGVERAGGKAPRLVDNLTDMPVDAQRIAQLEMLRIFHEMTRALRVNVGVAETSAWKAGASYADIAAAEGVSRQAVRQRLDRQRRAFHQRRTVRLVGGPYDGEEAGVLGGDAAVTKVVFVSRRAGYDFDDEASDSSWGARYVASCEDPDTLVFEKITQS